MAARQLHHALPFSGRVTDIEHPAQFPVCQNNRPMQILFEFKAHGRHLDRLQNFQASLCGGCKRTAAPDQYIFANLHQFILIPPEPCFRAPDIFFHLVHSKVQHTDLRIVFIRPDRPGSQSGLQRAYVKTKHRRCISYRLGACELFSAANEHMMAAASPDLTFRLPCDTDGRVVGKLFHRLQRVGGRAPLRDKHHHGPFAPQLRDA